jgi:glycerate kinase
MKILVAINSFKGSLSSKDISDIARKYFEKLNYTVETIPISDGGDGFVDAIKCYYHMEGIRVDTKGPLFDDLFAEYVIIKDTAYIELSSSSGMNKIDKSRHNPMHTTTYGFGLLIDHAIKSGAKKIVLGLGGSATNDGGAGMLQALGVKFFNQTELIETPISGKHLGKITRIDTDQLKNKIKGIEFEVASDVTNPLLGKDGCANTYSSQKGASSNQVYELEDNMKNYASIVNQHFKTDLSNHPGAGAAGGVGFGVLTFLNAKLTLGINFVLKLFEVEKMIMNSDIVFVGEGKLDFQTTFGKAPLGIAQLAKAHHKKVIGLFALADLEHKPATIDEVYTIVPNITTHEESFAHPAYYFTKMLENVRF